MKPASFAIIALLSCLPLAAKNLGDMKCGPAVTELLAGRLTLRLPPEARIKAMSHGLMSAPASQAEETRAVVDAGPQRMVIMAYELFSLASDDVERRISEQFKRNGEKIRLRPWELPSGLKAYAFFPESATRDEVANLVMGVYLIRSDQTIQQVAIYVNPEGAQASAKASILAGAICATLAEGKRSLNQASGERELMAVSPQKSMLVTVPNGYVTTRQDGPDFRVYHIRKLVMFGEEAMSIGVYLGDYPSGQTGYTRRETGRLFEREIEWSEEMANENGESSIDDDAIVPLAYPGLPSYADVFLHAGDVAGMQELKTTAATLRIGDPKR